MATNAPSRHARRLARQAIAHVETDERLRIAAADELHDLRVPDDLDVGIGEQPVLQDFSARSESRRWMSVTSWL